LRRFRWLRFAPPPANIRCASGAKTCGVTNSSRSPYRTEDRATFPYTQLQTDLRPFVPELPAYDDVLAKLKQLLPDFFPD
jgi:hypothetical protein